MSDIMTQALGKRVNDLRDALYQAEHERDQARARCELLWQAVRKYRNGYRYQRRAVVAAISNLVKASDDDKKQRRTIDNLNSERAALLELLHDRDTELAACAAECARLKATRGDGSYTEDVEPAAVEWRTVLGRCECCHVWPAAIGPHHQPGCIRYIKEESCEL